MSWTNADASDRVWELVGLTIIDATEQEIDPCFLLSNKSVLELFVDTPTDPWVLHLPDITVVGPLQGQSGSSPQGG